MQCRLMSLNRRKEIVFILRQTLSVVSWVSGHLCGNRYTIVDKQSVSLQKQTYTACVSLTTGVRAHRKGNFLSQSARNFQLVSLSDFARMA